MTEADHDRTEVEVFSTATNTWVVRTPGRRFPAVVMQGDTLFALFREAESLLSSLRAASGIGSDLLEAAQGLRDALDERLQHYEAVLHKHGIGLPYNR